MRIARMALAIALVVSFVGSADATLVGYWTFDNNVTDSAGFAAGNHNGTNVGGVYSVDTPAVLGGTSIDLTDDGDYVIIDQFTGTAGEGDFDLGGAMTVSAWVKGWPNGSWEPFVSKRGESGQGWQIRKYSGNNEACFTLRGTSGADDPRGKANVNNSNWKLFVGTYDGASRILYVDGVIDDIEGDGGTIANTPAMLVFGARDNNGTSGNPPNIGNYSQIMIDDVAIWDSALTPNQVTYLAKGGDPMNLPAAAPVDLLGVTQNHDPQSGLFGIYEVVNNGVLNSVGDAIASIESGGGTIFQGLSSVVNFNDPNNAGAGGYFGNASKTPFLSDTGADNNDIALLASAVLLITTPGDYTFGFRGDDGSQLRILGADFTKRWGGGDVLDDTIIFNGPTGNSDTAASTYLDPGTYPLEFLFFERGGGAYVELWAAPGIHSSFDASVFRLIGDTANGGLMLTPEPATLSLVGLGCLLALRRRRR